MASSHSKSNTVSGPGGLRTTCHKSVVFWKKIEFSTILDHLEPQYDRLLARYKSSLTGDNSERHQPCLCLVCGKVLSGGEKDSSNIGACHRHINTINECNGSVLGTGMMLDLKSTAIILFRNKWAAYYPSLYVDKYGETDRNMRRGAPLHLNVSRLKKLKHLWISGGLPNEVVRIRNSSDRIIMENWYWKFYARVSFFFTRVYIKLKTVFSKWFYVKGMLS